jgi:hypothetical protein
VSEQPDLRDLVGEDVTEAELESLRRVDELLRATTPAPEVPQSLTASVRAIPAARPPWRSRRIGAAVAAAAALAAGTFAIGFWTGGDSEPPPALERIELVATGLAPRSGMAIEIYPIDQAGNWAMLADVWGLEPLPEGGYYEVWLTQGSHAVSSCGRFVVDATGGAENVWLNAPYSFRQYDRWIVTAHVPGQEPSGPLLDGPVAVPA